MTAAIDLDALLDALAAKLAPHVAKHMSANSTPASGPVPIAAVATRWAITTRRVRTFARTHGIAIGGSRKHPTIDADAFAAAWNAPRASSSHVADLVRRRTGGR
jgi:hypothetical protein